MAARFEGRERFCRDVLARPPPSPAGERSVLGDLVGAVVGPLVDAMVKIWEMRTEQDRLRRDPIRAQLEATRWPAYGDVPPSR